MEVFFENKTIIKSNFWKYQVIFNFDYKLEKRCVLKSHIFLNKTPIVRLAASLFGLALSLHLLHERLGVGAKNDFIFR